MEPFSSKERKNVTRRLKGTKALVTGLIAAIIMIAGCQEASVTSQPSSDLSAAISTVEEMRVFFGHQSVGTNVLDGIRALKGMDVSMVDIKADATGAVGSGAAILHASIGRNLHPDEKISDFAELMRSGIGESTDVSFMKLCYVDANAGFTAVRIFDSYVSEMERLEGEYPDTVMVYFTMPLMSEHSGIKDRVKELLGRTTPGREGNVERNRFNDMLRKAKGYTGRLFDIAAVEATGVDGTRETFRLGGESYEAMVTAYTTDGGHLNELGRRIVAEELVLFLARLR